MQVWHPDSKLKRFPSCKKNHRLKGMQHEENHRGKCRAGKANTILQKQPKELVKRQRTSQAQTKRQRFWLQGGSLTAIIWWKSSSLCECKRRHLLPIRLREGRKPSPECLLTILWVHFAPVRSRSQSRNHEKLNHRISAVKLCERRIRPTERTVLLTTKSLLHPIRTQLFENHATKDLWVVGNEEQGQKGAQLFGSWQNQKLPEKLWSVSDWWKRTQGQSYGRYYMEVRLLSVSIQIIDFNAFD